VVFISNNAMIRRGNCKCSCLARSLVLILVILKWVRV
jgi:hypothetical protein